MRRLPPIKKSNRSRTLAFEPLFLRGSVMLPRDRVAFCTEGMPLPAAWPAACPRIPFGNDSYTFYCCTTGTRLLAPLSRSTHSATISALVRALSRLLRFTVGVKFIQYRFPKHRSPTTPADSTVHSSSMFLLLVATAAATAALDRVDLFVPTPRFPCFRQPAIASIAVPGESNTSFV